MTSVSSADPSSLPDDPPNTSGLAGVTQKFKLISQYASLDGGRLSPHVTKDLLQPKMNFEGTFLQRTNFAEDINYQALQPGLRLTWLALHSPQAMHLIYRCINDVPTEILLADGAKNLEMPRSPYLRNGLDNPLSPSETADVNWLLSRMAGMLHFQRNPAGANSSLCQLIPEGEDGYKRRKTVPQRASRICIDDSLLRVLERYHDRGLSAPPSIVVSEQVELAHNIVHEFGHAIWMAVAKETGREPLWSGEIAAEWGYMYEQAILGGIPRISSRHKIVDGTVLKRKLGFIRNGGSFWLMKWPSPYLILMDLRKHQLIPLRQPIVSPEDEFLEVPLPLLVRLFQRKFWRKEVRKHGIQALRPPDEHTGRCTIIRKADVLPNRSLLTKEDLRRLPIAQPENHDPEARLFDYKQEEGEGEMAV